jgi:predicted transcriptional regulator
MLRPKRHYRGVTPEIAEFARWLYFKGKFKQHEIGRIIGRTQGNVSKIISEQIWSR